MASGWIAISTVAGCCFFLSIPRRLADFQQVRDASESQQSGSEALSAAGINTSSSQQQRVQQHDASRTDADQRRSKAKTNQRLGSVPKVGTIKAIAQLALADPGS